MYVSIDWKELYVVALLVLYVFVWRIQHGWRPEEGKRRPSEWRLLKMLSLLPTSCVFDEL